MYRLNLFANEAIPTESLFDMVLAGGPLLIPIFIASFVLVLVIFERFISLRRGKVIPPVFVRQFLTEVREGTIDRATAIAHCSDSKSPIAKVFLAAIRKWGKPAVEVEQAILDEGERAGNHLRKNLRVINTIATISPLLGLLGTVWGMMDAFNAIANVSAMGKPELLAGGISSALLSTAAGLIVAIPALIFYFYFVGRVDSHVMKIDEYGQGLVHLISAEGLHEIKTTKISKTSKISKKQTLKAA